MYKGSQGEKTVILQYGFLPKHIRDEELTPVSVSDHLIFFLVPAKYTLARLVAVDVQAAFHQVKVVEHLRTLVGQTWIKDSRRSMAAKFVSQAMALMPGVRSQIPHGNAGSAGADPVAMEEMSKDFTE